MSDTTERSGQQAPQEPSLDEQIAAYQREFRDLDPQVEKVVSALGRLNPASSRTSASATPSGRSSRPWSSPASPTGWAPANSPSASASPRPP